MIQLAMETLHMSYEEVMWKRSWTVIEMLMADKAKQVKKGATKMTGKQMAARHLAKISNQ